MENIRFNRLNNPNALEDINKKLLAKRRLMGQFKAGKIDLATCQNWLNGLGMSIELRELSRKLKVR